MLRFIRSAQAAGFTLEHIAERIALDFTVDRAHEPAIERHAALDAMVAELKRSREALARLAHECSAGSTALCPIISSFESV